MSWRVFAQKFDVSDLSDTSMYQKFSFTNDTILKAIRTQFIVIGDPTFTDLFAMIYSDDNGSPGALIATSSNSVTKTQLFLDETGIDTGDRNSVSSVYFEFLIDNSQAVEGISLKGGENYHIVINANGAASFSDSSHIGWLLELGSPLYSTITSTSNYSEIPHPLIFIGSEI